MLRNKTKNDLLTKPSLLAKYPPSHANWIEALHAVATNEGKHHHVINKYYTSLEEKYRPQAASIIAASSHDNSIRQPDAYYLYAWLATAFATRAKIIKNGWALSGRSNNSTCSSALSAWLQHSPELRACLPDFAGATLRDADAGELKIEHLMVVFNDIIPRKFRRSSVYKACLQEVPTFLIEAAKHINERECLLQMDSEQCRYAAFLPEQWKSVYPTSTIAKKVNNVLGLMKSLDHYSPEIFRRPSFVIRRPSFVIRHPSFPPITPAPPAAHPPAPRDFRSDDTHG